MTETTDRPCGIERTATGAGVNAAVGLDDQVDEALARDQDH